MAGNKWIIGLIITLGLLFIAIISILLLTFLDSPFTASAIKSDTSSSEISNSISFQDRITAMVNVSDRGLEICGKQVSIYYRTEEYDLANEKLEECRIIINNYENEVDTLETYSISNADKREVELMRLSLDIDRTAMSLIQETINLQLRKDTLTRNEIRQVALSIKDHIYIHYKSK